MQSWADVGIMLPPTASGEVDTTCPKCSSTRKNQRDPCLSVNVQKQVWECFHCGWTGSLKGGGEPRPSYNRPQPLPPPEDGLNVAILKWFERRGIPEEVVRRNKITGGPAWMPQVDNVVTAIQFPYFRHGELINVKYRAHPKHFRMVRGAERILYGLDDCATATDIKIVEGEMDKLALDVAGITTCVSVPDGAPAPNAKNYASKFAFLDNDLTQEMFERTTDVTIAVDNDEPGDRLAEELARRIGPEKCYRVVWPEGCKDANDTLLQYGPEGVRDAIAAAKPWPLEGLFGEDELAPEILHIFEHGLPTGISTGWRNVDLIYRPLPGMVTVLTGVPGSGKSVLLNAALVNITRAHGWGFGVCSPEMQPMALHAARLIACYIGKPIEGPGKMSEGEFNHGRAWLREYVNFILPPQPTVDAILHLARVLVYRKGIRGLIIDPWTEIDHSRPDGLNEAEYTSQVLTRVRKFAAAHNVHVWWVAHPAKPRTGSLDNPDWTPSPYEISGAAAWYNKPDYILSLWRDKDDDAAAVELRCYKVRFDWTGDTGSALLRFDRATGRYRDA